MRPRISLPSQDSSVDAAAVTEPTPRTAAIAPSRTIADCIAAGRNNFLLLRFLAAGLVLFGHSWAIALNPSGESDWLAQRTLLFSGTLAVNMFFFVSGFLVTMSYERRHSLWAFGKARVLRIFPALLVCVALSAVLLGPIISTLTPAAYFGDPQWWRYLIGNVSLLDLQWKLPGVFTTNRHPDIVNGALWTLPGEIQMYLYVAALGLLGLLRTRFRFGLALAALLIVAVWFGDRVAMVSQAEYYGFAAFFAFGAFCWMQRDRVHVSGPILLLLLFACAVFYRHPGYQLVLGAATAYFCLWFVYAPRMDGFNRFGDYSYGLYLYGFIMQQLVALWFPDFGPWRSLLLSFPLALACAIASWHLVEKPALRLK